MDAVSDRSKHRGAKCSRRAHSFRETRMKLCGDVDGGSISDGPECGHESSRSSGEERTGDSRKFVTHVNGVATGFAAGEEHEIGVEIKLENVAQRKPTIGKAKAGRIGKRRHKSSVACKMNDRRVARGGTERRNGGVVADEHACLEVRCHSRDFLVDQRRIRISDADHERIFVASMRRRHACNRSAWS
jgi:hypothetical protein